MPDTQYYLDIDDDTVVVNGELTNYRERTRGGTVTYEFYLSGDGGATDTGGTAGEDHGFTAGGPAGATASTAPLSRHRSAYRRLTDLHVHADAAAYGTDINNEPWYRERLPTDAPVDSLVVGIRPGSGIHDAPALWVLVTGGTDDTRLIGTRAMVSLQGFVLADLSEYESRSALSTDLEAQL